MIRRRFTKFATYSFLFWEFTLTDEEMLINYRSRDGFGDDETKMKVVTRSSPENLRSYAEKEVAKYLKKGYDEEEIKPDAPPLVRPFEEFALPDPPTPPDPEPYTGMEPKLLFTDDELAWAPWRQIPRRPRPTPPAWNAREATIRMRECEAAYMAAGRPHWINELMVPPTSMSPTEAWFWLRAASKRLYEDTDMTYYARLLNFAETPPDSPEDFIAATWEDANRFRRANLAEAHVLSPPHLGALASVLEPERLAQLILDDSSLLDDDSYRILKTHVYMFLSDADLATWGRLIRERLAATPVPPAGSKRFDLPKVLPVAATLGFGDIAYDWLKQLQPGAFNYDIELQACIISAPTPEACRDLDSTFRSRIREGFVLAGLVAQLGYSALETQVRDCRDNDVYSFSQDWNYGTFEVLARIICPRTAMAMWSARKLRERSAQALNWLQTYPGQAILGLAPLACDPDYKERDTVIQYLQGLLVTAGSEVFEQALAALPDDQQALLRDAIIVPAETVAAMGAPVAPPAWLAPHLTDKLDKKPLPDWLIPAALPPLEVEGGRLDETAIRRILGALAACKFDKPHPAIVALREHLDAGTLAEWGWTVFQTWLMSGADTKLKWAFDAAAYLGGDDLIERLMPLLEEWHHIGEFARSKHGLVVISLLGSAAAIGHLDKLARKSKVNSFRKQATKVLETMASARGISVHELTDAALPNLGFDATGKLVYDFGPRQFTVILDDQLKPSVRDEKGTVRPNLPKPSGKDDAKKSAAATAAWKDLKKALRDLLSAQVTRLEQAMVGGSTWPLDGFEKRLAKHPVMTLVSRRLLWATVDTEGKPGALFRVTDDMQYADVNDDPYTPPADCRICLPHPALLPADSRTAWAPVFADYEIVQPFAQLNRPVFLAVDLGADLTTLKHARDDAKVLVFTVIRGLEAHGWSRGPTEDSGYIYTFILYHAASQQHGRMELRPGYPVYMPDEIQEQQLPTAQFFPDTGKGKKPTPNRQSPLPLREVHPVILSDAALALESMAAKADSAT